MNRPAHKLTKNITRLLPTPTTPSELDKLLYKQIQDYVAKHSWRSLAAEVKSFVNNQYKSAYGLVADGTISPDELEREIKSQIPSRTYIEEYSKGRPICYRYTNTLANFFNQEYVLSNHDACEEFLVKVSR